MIAPILRPVASAWAVRRHIGYSAGNLGKSIVWASFDTFLLYYLVHRAGFMPLAAGGLLLALHGLDAVASPVIAYLTDRRADPKGLARLISLGAPLCGISFWAIFAPGATPSRAFIAVAVIGCRVGYALCDIGHNALMVRVSTDTRRAATISGLRLIFSAIGAGMVGSTAAGILAQAGRQQHAALATAALLGGFIYIVTLLCAMHVTRALPCGNSAFPKRLGRVREHLAALWVNAAYRRVLLLVAAQAGLIGLLNRALPFLGDATHGGAAWAGMALTLITVAQAASLPFWILFSRDRLPEPVLAAAYVTALAGIGFLGLARVGPLATAGLLLFGVGQGGMNLAIWAMLALSVRPTRPSDIQHEALPIALFLAILKASVGLGGALVSIAVAAGQRASPSHIDRWPVLIVALLCPIAGCAICLWTISRPWRRGFGGSFKPVPQTV
jgi:Na+/melibiose symporter-like transporter